MPIASVHRLFVYDVMLSGEPGHGLLNEATLEGLARTEATFHLVDLGAYGALVPGGALAIHGEVYAVDRATCLAIDVQREVPILFQRASVRLSDGTVAETHVLTLDQVRGRRRLAAGDWRKRFALPFAPADRPWSEWVRRQRS